MKSGIAGVALLFVIAGACVAPHRPNETSSPNHVRPLDFSGSYTIDFGLITDLERIRPLVESCTDLGPLERLRTGLETATDLEDFRSQLEAVDRTEFRGCPRIAIVFGITPN